MKYSVIPTTVRTQKYSLQKVLPAIASAMLAFIYQGEAQTIFTDDFNSGASPLWGNEVGLWSAQAGVYVAAAPFSPPFAYSSLPYNLTDFTFECDVNNVKDGGIWLRSANNANGVLLVTGGDGGIGTGLYWHTVSAGVFSSILNQTSGLFVSGVSDARLRVTVTGDTYSVFVNGATTPATTLTTAAYPSGKVALIANARPSDTVIQTFDNVVLAVPEPSTLGISAVGSFILLMRRRRAK